MFPFEGDANREEVLKIVNHLVENYVVDFSNQEKRLSSQFFIKKDDLYRQLNGKLSIKIKDGKFLNSKTQIGKLIKITFPKISLNSKISNDPVYLNLRRI